TVWHYTGRPDLDTALHEHASLVSIVASRGCEVIHHDEPLADHADAIFCHDPALVTDAGAILLQMGKALRRGEEAALGEVLAKAGVPILARLHGDALAEGGDLLWIDERTLAVGIGFRTNREGARQIQEALGSSVEVVPVELPYYTGPEACLHLMSLLSMIDADLAVGYPALIPVPFMQLLEDRGIRFVDVPESEFLTMATNVLALAPRDCIMLEGNPTTRARLEATGCRVAMYRGAELSLKAEGGATCLTRPVLRG
ncbi:MAG: dimethylarginine dimethylaminohydrolase family protein, partial [Gemmatimonadales bacterium]